jgi:hypothetical protein
MPGRRIPVNTGAARRETGKPGPLLERACRCWRDIDKEVDDRIAKGVGGN